VSEPDGFVLHPRLTADSYLIRSLPLSELRLINDARWPWLILVPRVVHAAEWLDLDVTQRHQLDTEIEIAGRCLRATFPCDRLNVAALGNVVPQLHIHVIARHDGDPNWPGPVWGFGQAQPYSEAGRPEIIHRLEDALSTHATE